MTEDSSKAKSYYYCQFCGSTVAVLSLLSPSVARFRLDADREQIVDALIGQRSLYVMR